MGNTAKKKNNNNPATQRKDTEKVAMKKVSSVSKILLLLLFLRSQMRSEIKKIFLRNFHFKVSNAKKKKKIHILPSLPPKNSLYYSYMREGVRGCRNPPPYPPVVSQSAISHPPIM